jgi:hypothetical protein
MMKMKKMDEGMGNGTDKLDGDVVPGFPDVVPSEAEAPYSAPRTGKKVTFNRGGY